MPQDYYLWIINSSIFMSRHILTVDYSAFQVGWMEVCSNIMRYNVLET